MIMNLTTMMVTVGLSPEFLTPAVYANLANSHQKLGNHRRAIELAERFRDSLFQDVAQHPDYQVGLSFRSG